MLRGLDYQNSRTHLSRVCGWVCGVRGCHRLWLSESLLVRGGLCDVCVVERGVSLCRKARGHGHDRVVALYTGNTHPMLWCVDVSSPHTRPYKGVGWVWIPTRIHTHPVSLMFRQCPTLPHDPSCSTIGVGRLNDRVRNGTGCFPSTMATGKPENHTVEHI